MNESDFGGAAAARLFKSRLLEVFKEMRATKWTEQSPELLRVHVKELARACAWTNGCTTDTGDALAEFAIETLVIDLPDGPKSLATA